jgi:pilus assembly protein Flp/PilA
MVALRRRTAVSQFANEAVRFVSTNVDGRSDSAAGPYDADMDSTNRAMAFLNRLTRRLQERGQGMVEYAMILVMVALVVLIALQILGRTTNNVYSNIANGLNQ